MPLMTLRLPLRLARLRLASLYVLSGSALVLLEVRLVQADQPLRFEPGFMRQGPAWSSEAGSHALDALASSKDLGPGRYRVEIQLNQSHFGQRELNFVQSPDGDRLLPCLTPEILTELGVKLDSLAETGLRAQTCIDVLGLIPGSKLAFDGGKLVLQVSIPHIAMRRDVAGYVDPQRWDAGINAAFVNYQVSVQQGNSRYRGDTHSSDLYLNSGLNLGAWRLRSSQTLRQNPEGGREWSRAHTYVQRDLPGTHANLTLGETFTSGDIFRSLPIKGAIIASDLGMLPDIQQSYAPTIRGVAQSRAKLEVLQNGYPVYSTYVSPGPYEIDDLGTAGSGELEIVLTEDNGQIRRYFQPYATLGNLLRKDVWNYSAALGRYNPQSGADNPLLAQGTLAVGIGWNSTLYGGLMGSGFYQASTFGVARDLGSIGALALDITRSSADIDTLDARTVEGLSYAVKYGKSFATRTNLRFAGYRYSTQGYRDFDEAVRERDRSAAFQGSRRSRLEASLYQHVGSNSAVSLTLSQQDFWQRRDVQRQFQFNFNTHYRGVSYNLFATQSLSNSNDNNRQFGLSVSLPLEFGRSSNATFDAHSSNGRYSQRASLGGAADENRLSYRTTLSHDDNNARSASLSLGYQAPIGNIGAGMTQANDYRNISLNASGAALFHGGGIELGPYLGETIGLVHVPDIADVGVVNATGVRTNSRGYALVPYLRPYRLNQIELKTDRLGPETDIENGVAQVVPRRAAIIKTTFPARTVNRMVITGRTAAGQPLPFGAQVTDAQGSVIGIVGQAGQVMLTTSAEPQTLNVQWGDASKPQCQLSIDPHRMAQQQGYRLQELTCH